MRQKKTIFPSMPTKVFTYYLITMLLKCVFNGTAVNQKYTNRSSVAQMRIDCNKLMKEQ